MRLFINNGLIVDPGSGSEYIGSILIEDGIIKEIAPEGAVLSRSEVGEAFVIDAAGKWVVPGLIDLHVHFREPGYEYKEDVHSGSRSAAKGGFSVVCCMPNTNPVIDSSKVVRWIDQRALNGNGVQVLSMGAVTKGQQGEELADYEAMIGTETVFGRLTGKGICGISEDGKTVEDRELMLAAMIKAKELGLTVYSHAEPEMEIVKRDLLLAEKAGCRLHFCHISEKESIRLIREAKQRGQNVTAETAPHYFALSSSDVKGNTNKKMNPPLRSIEDMEAVKEALKDGTLDAIATDHAPHHIREKNLPYEQALNGVIGLETSFPVSYSRLVQTGVLTPLELISKMSTEPARILGIDRGSIRIGGQADLTIIDTQSEYEIGPGHFLSKSLNSPFIGEKVNGEIIYTIIGGRIVWKSPKY